MEWFKHMKIDIIQNDSKASPWIRKYIKLLMLMVHAEA